MTEFEKFQSGKPYNMLESPELLEISGRAKDLCDDYNRTRFNERARQDEILRALLGSVGERVRITPTFWCDFGFNIHLGEDFYANHNLTILDHAPVVFGDRCMVGPNCGFYAVTHPIDPVERATGVEWGVPITIGNDVWFGGDVSVLPGVTIGDEVVVGAGSVVTKDVPPRCVVAGNPARVVRAIR